jgi:hypothetical protein
MLWPRRGRIAAVGLQCNSKVWGAGEIFWKPLPACLLCNSGQRLASLPVLTLRSQSRGWQAYDCCTPGEAVAVTGVKAVVVRQKLSGAILSVAEIKIFVGDEEVSSNADCFSFPTQGYWGNMDKVTGAEWRLNDGDLSTHSHAGDWNAAVQNYGTHACTHTHSRMQARTHASAHTGTHTYRERERERERESRTRARTHTDTHTRTYTHAHTHFI